MNLVSMYTESHRILKEEWFVPSFKDNYQLHMSYCPVKGRGTFMQENWSKAILFKSKVIIKSIRKFWGCSFIYSDVDVQFFDSIDPYIKEALIGHDIVCQLNRPYGTFCTGFFAIKANKLTLKLWEQVREAVLREHRDQPAFNRLIRVMKGIRYRHLPEEFFGGGTFNETRWSPGDELKIPKYPVMHHANCTISVTNKIAQLSYVKASVLNNNSLIPSQ